MQRHTIQRHRRRLLAAGIVCALVAGCSGTASPDSTTADTAPQVDPNAVSVLGLFSGPELTSFQTVWAEWERTTGNTVDWSGARDLTGQLDDLIAAGTPPDIAILPNVGLLHELAENGQLVPLATVLDAAQLEQDYAQPWLDLGSHDGERYGVPYKVTNKSTVWYSPKTFEASGYALPTTWDEMIALADTMVADGHTPFSIVAPKVPGGGGWALTDLVSQIVLNTCGTTAYDGWVAGTVAWTDPCIRDSFERFLTVVQTPGYALGGTDGILNTGDADGSYPLYTDPPEAYLYPMASFAQAFIAAEYPDLLPGDDYDFFHFPMIDPAHAGSVTIGADIVVMLNDTPAARSFMAYLAGAESQQVWIELGGFTSVNRSVSPDAYADPVALKAATELTGAPIVRFSAGDAMPAVVQQAWWKGMVALVKDPTTLDPLLEEMTTTAAAARP